MRWVVGLALLELGCPADECDEVADNRCEGNVVVRCDDTIDNAGPTSLSRVVCPTGSLCTEDAPGQPPACVRQPASGCLQLGFLGCAGDFIESCSSFGTGRVVTLEACPAWPGPQVCREPPGDGGVCQPAPDGGPQDAATGAGSPDAGASDAAR